MSIMTADNTSSSSIGSSISEASSMLSSISSCCSHSQDTTNNSFGSNNNNNNNNNNNIRQTSLQFILNQNNNNHPLDYWEFDDYSEEEEEEDINNLNNLKNLNSLNSEYNNNYFYYYNSFYPNTVRPDYHHQQNCQYPSHDKFLSPPPSPPCEMDFIEDGQILSTDEFNSIFESFNNVVEGHSYNINEDGCLRDLNYSNSFLDDEQLSKALDAIAMI
ncbi:hypothetical protein RclHR1_01380008 [Rhizophagus clarus]|uniref:Uncharacterized protein n=1 Tax=Rhizophagus clarus TaxID=94130 RepID=A0A2Z6R3J1_9GLOM|nr:hypothetical protein RclHR1_01380008 [Rhizophagus clarus]GET02051.1 hypothetical protein GLOIN_2v1646877 [Rhizophagus clarus]